MHKWKLLPVLLLLGQHILESSFCFSWCFPFTSASTVMVKVPPSLALSFTFVMVALGYQLDWLKSSLADQESMLLDMPGRSRWM